MRKQIAGMGHSARVHMVRFYFDAEHVERITSLAQIVDLFLLTASGMGKSTR